MKKRNYSSPNLKIYSNVYSKIMAGSDREVDAKKAIQFENTSSDASPAARRNLWDD